MILLVTQTVNIVLWMIYRVEQSFTVKVGGP